MAIEAQHVAVMIHGWDRRGHRHAAHGVQELFLCSCGPVRSAVPMQHVTQQQRREGLHQEGSDSSAPAAHGGDIMHHHAVVDLFSGAHSKAMPSRQQPSKKETI